MILWTTESIIFPPTMNNTTSDLSYSSPPPIPLIVCWAVMGLASTLLNLVVCALVALNGRLVTVTNAFVVSLSVSDLLVAAVFVPIYIKEEYSSTKVAISGYIISLLLLASIFNLCAVTYERYIALTKPFGYRTIMNKKKTAAIIFLSWFVPLIICLLPIAWKENPMSDYHKVYLITVVLAFVLLPCIGMVWVYAKLLKIVRNFIQRNRRRTSHGNKTGERAGTEEKAARVFAIILGMFLLCWLPFMYINVCHAFQLNHLITNGLSYTSFFTLLLNTILDPLIFAFLKRDFKERIFKGRKGWMSARSSAKQSDHEEMMTATCLETLN